MVPTEEMPAFIFVERDEETGEKRWFSIKGMGVEYVRASDAVTALSVLRDEIAILSASLAKAEAERDELAKALEPFAKIAELENGTRDGGSVIVNVDRCRDARRALSHRKESP